MSSTKRLIKIWNNKILFAIIKNVINLYVNIVFYSANYFIILIFEQKSQKVDVYIVRKWLID